MEKKLTDRIDLSALENDVSKIKNEIKKVIVGHDDMLDLFITALLANGHILIEGVPGVAKTLTAKLFAKTISVDFSRIQFTPDLMPSDVLGTSVYNLKTSEFEFKKGPIFSNLILIDEINRAPAKTQSALFEVMEERQITIDGIQFTMSQPFLVAATQNPIEHEGTYKLPEAQLDRFLFKLIVDYPSLEEEELILKEFHENKIINPLDLISPVVSGEQIKSYQNLVREIVVDEPLIKYIAQIINHTRNHNALFLGGSPRASLSLLISSKAYAAVQGKDFVTPEDIRQVLFPVLGHRVILTPEKEMEGIKTEDILKQIIEAIEVPR